MSEENEGAPGTARMEVRPGLTMVKRRTLKEDGRYLIYYDFERDETRPAGDATASRPAS